MLTALAYTMKLNECFVLYYLCVSRHICLGVLFICMSSLLTSLRVVSRVPLFVYGRI